MRRSGERGSANVKFLIVIALMAVTAYAGYLYIPVAFQANAYKDLMQHYADVACTQGYQTMQTPDGDLRTLPNHLAEQGGLDGFYDARLTRLD